MTDDSNAESKTETRGVTRSECASEKKKPRTVSGRSFLPGYRTRSVIGSSRTESAGERVSFRVDRYSGISPRSPPVRREGVHFNVVARRGRHWVVPQSGMFLKEAFGGVQLRPL